MDTVFIRYEERIIYGYYPVLIGTRYSSCHELWIVFHIREVTHGMPVVETHGRASQRDASTLRNAYLPVIPESCSDI